MAVILNCFCFFEMGSIYQNACHLKVDVIKTPNLKYNFSKNIKTYTTKICRMKARTFKYD